MKSEHVYGSYHEAYMAQALAYAQEAYDNDEVPIGAIIVNASGDIIGVGYNQVESKKSQLMHAELQALRQATESVGNWRLEDTTLYVTLEPCTMCFAAATISRVKTIIFGAYSPIFGFQLDKDRFVPLYNNDALFIQGGVKEQECSTLLKQFFQKKRTKVERT